jgi:hypothetical protein
VEHLLIFHPILEHLIFRFLRVSVLFCLPHQIFRGELREKHLAKSSKQAQQK